MLTRLLPQGSILGKEKKGKQSFRLGVEGLKGRLLEVKQLPATQEVLLPSTILLREI